MAKGRITSEKSWLTMGILIGLLFIVVWWVFLYDCIKSWEFDFRLILMILVWLFVFIICIKWFIQRFKKQKIRKNKELMRRIDAKVTWFNAFGHNNDGSPVSYYFIASDWVDQFESEEFYANVVWLCGDIEKTLEMMQIPYNPKDINPTIRALEDRLKTIEMERQQCEWLKAMMFDSSYNSTRKIKEQLESWVNPYMEFRWHKLSVGDEVVVYVDHGNSKIYWVDTDFLYN